ncbi:Conserved_hypothetical protein [Hexamita inflata]|uniref:Uncharacterized protein n=1 Tax=Hexamita inflata TaxID=28002 RepID=A0AA86NQY1_9EUKA|nr:Conserved hypothetical protein [Hexamita inflata]
MKGQITYRHADVLNMDHFKSGNLLQFVSGSSFVYYSANDECVYECAYSASQIQPKSVISNLQNVVSLLFQPVEQLLVVCCQQSVKVFNSAYVLVNSIDLQSDQHSAVVHKNNLFVLSRFSSILFQKNESKYTKLEFKAIQLFKLNNQVFVIGENQILNVDSLQFVPLQIQGKIETVCEYEQKMAVVTSERQIIILTNEFKSEKTIQKVSKQSAVFMKQHKDKIILASEANEIINVEIQQNTKQRKEQTITQVKMDFYNSEFKADSIWIGADAIEGKCAGITETGIYCW